YLKEQLGIIQSLVSEVAAATAKYNEQLEYLGNQIVLCDHVETGDTQRASLSHIKGVSFQFVPLCQNLDNKILQVLGTGQSIRSFNDDDSNKITNKKKYHTLLQKQDKIFGPILEQRETIRKSATRIPAMVKDLEGRVPKS